MLSLFQFQLLAIAFLCALLVFLEKSAALRGTNGEPMPLGVDRALHVVFFVIIFGPLVYSFWWMTPILLYFPFYCDLSERKGGRPSPWIKGMRCWKWLKSYWSLQLVKTAELPAGKQYILGVHPHGILPIGSMVNISSDCNDFTSMFPGVELRGLAASFCFFVPFYRDLILGGGVCDAARYTAHQLLEHGKSILLVPGGATEALYSVPGKDVLYLKKRLGFVRLALQHGASLVPVYGFNENNTFDQLDVKWKSIMALKRKFQAILGISLPLITNIIPKRCRITTVVGAPIAVPKIAKPTDAQVREYLDKYIDAVEALYAEHGPKFNTPSNKELEII